MPAIKIPSSIIPISLLIFMVSMPAFDPAYSSEYSSHITLDKIPSFAYAGETVTFTGRVMSGTYPVAGVIVEIKEDDTGWFDQRLAAGWTDANGEFSIPWQVSAGFIELDFDIYAVFEGDSEFVRDRSYNQNMRVEKMSGSITLDPIPSTAKIGEAIIFSGTLRLVSGNTEGAIVYIQDEDTGNPDDLLATAYVDKNGRFSANWFVSDTDADSIIDIYAVFEGDSENYRLTTCDHGPTRSFGGLCADTIKLRISGYAQPTLPTDDTSEYMELHYSRPFIRNPHVAIVPAPDSYDTVRNHIGSVQEGIRLWKGELEQRFGGDWNVSFEIVQGQYYKAKPDVVINLVTNDEDQGCGDEYFGWALIYRNPPSTINTHVCSTSNGILMPNSEVSATAAHEFIHAMGLGHTFNKIGDLMCSEEDGVPTCKYAGPKSKTPSSLNLDAVAKIYGTDGFRSPNNHVRNGEKFSQNDAYLNGGGSPDPSLLPPSQPIPIKPTVSECQRSDAKYDFDIDGKVISPNSYTWWTLCTDRIVEYYFSTYSNSEGFTIFVLPPETDPNSFANNRDGSYYECEKYGQIWTSKPGDCNIESGSKIMLYNHGTGTISVDGWVKTVDDCKRTDYTYNYDIDTTIKPSGFQWWTLCTDRTVEYRFTTGNNNDGFQIFILPPETSIRAFIYERVGNYYTCEEYEQAWTTKSGKCNIAPGSKIVIYNQESNTINIDGRILTR